MHITFSAGGTLSWSTIKERREARRATPPCLFALLFKSPADLLGASFMLSNANLSRTAAYITQQLKYINRGGTRQSVIVLIRQKDLMRRRLVKNTNSRWQENSLTLHRKPGARAFDAGPSLVRLGQLPRGNFFNSATKE